jgi:hypothetical protein
MRICSGVNIGFGAAQKLVAGGVREGDGGSWLPDCEEGARLGAGRRSPVGTKLAVTGQDDGGDGRW